MQQTDGAGLIKKFIASDLQRAESKARRALGAGMVLLAQRVLPSGDVEVVAGDQEGAREYYQRHGSSTPVIEEPPQAPTYSEHPDPEFAQNQPRQSSYENAQEGDGNFAQHYHPPAEDKTPPRQKRGLFGRRSTSSNTMRSPAAHERAQPMMSEDQRSQSVPTQPLTSTDEDTAYAPYQRETVMADAHTATRPQAPIAATDTHSPMPPLRYNGAGLTPSDPPSDLNTAPPAGGDAHPPIRRLSTSASVDPLMAEPTIGTSHSPSAPPSQGTGLNAPIERKVAENALSQLRDRLTSKGQSNGQSAHDQASTPLMNALRPHGISDRLMHMILHNAAGAKVDDVLYQLGMGLAASFNYSPLRSTAATPIMLVGPTGAGKTSCAAKLSAIALSEGDQATMITTDVGRAGALEQFATYSEKLAIDCYAAETPEEIMSIVREVQPRGALVLDTPGISPYDAGDLAALKSFQTAVGAEPVLVLPASGDVSEYSDWAHAFRAFGVRSCIITKFDATRRVGAGLSAAFEGNMTLTYFSETPFISEGLLPASPEFLAYRLMANYPGRIMQD